MTERELRKRAWIFLLKMAEALKLDESYYFEVADGLLRIPLDGFKASVDGLSVAHDFEIEKIAPDTNNALFEGMSGLDLARYHKKGNYFLATVRCRIARAGVDGPNASDHLLMMAIFFSLCCKQPIKVNEADAFVWVRGKLISLGTTRNPAAPLAYVSEAHFSDKDIETLQKLWPSFRDHYNHHPLFSLMARRYHFSIVRLRWEDKVLDSVMVLEALFVAGKSFSRGEIARRLSGFLAPHHEPSIVKGTVWKAYRLRYDLMQCTLEEESLDRVYDLVTDLNSYVKLALQIYLVDYAHMERKEFISAVDSMAEQIGGEEVNESDIDQ
jgi:hypothetical protein